MARPDGELFAERLRLKALAEARASGTDHPTTGLNAVVRTKLAAAWDDVSLHWSKLKLSLEDKSAAASIPLCL
jgi:hypothetical protein